MTRAHLEYAAPEGAISLSAGPWDPLLGSGKPYGVFASLSPAAPCGACPRT